MRLLTLIFSILATPLAAHEFWIEPLEYQIEADGSLEAHIVNGQEFAGEELAYLPNRFVNFVMFQGDEAQRVNGRPGDIPALQQEPLGEGLHIAAYESLNATVTYEAWEDFQKFVDHKDFGDIRSRHLERGISLDGFREIYSRYAKTLIGVGDNIGNDQRVGLETEIVALKNPYTDDLSEGMQVQVHYRNELRVDVQVEVFQKGPDGRVSIGLYRTNADGIATFPVQPGYRYMVDAVVLRAPNIELAATSNAVWETLWANLTFAVPAE
jgi:hypothetical protein